MKNYEVKKQEQLQLFEKGEAIHHPVHFKKSIREDFIRNFPG